MSERLIQDSVLKTLTTSAPDGNGYKLLNQPNKRMTVEGLKFSHLEHNWFSHLERLNKSKLSHVDGVIPVNDRHAILKSLPKKQEDARSAFCFGFTATIGNKVVELSMVDRTNFENNVFEVAEEVAVSGRYNCRLDIVLLINGTPMANLELKKASVSINDAINQVNKYTNNGNYKIGILNFINILSVSNNRISKYFARSPHVEDNRGVKYSYLFSWADVNNKNYDQAADFVRHFYDKDVFLELVMKMHYVPDDDKVLILSPHQFYGVDTLFRNACNGKSSFNWHSTGTGKTLCSYVLAKELATKSSFEKIIFIVDRVDLANQTADEYNKLSNDDSFTILRSGKLIKALKDNGQKIVVTTLQSLSLLLNDPGRNKGISNKNVAFIVDECHRSTSGDMLKRLKDWADSNTCVFLGFTGTPVFKKDLKNNDIKNTIRSTEDIFGKVGHIFTIADAIAKGNVLPFKVQQIDVNLVAKDGLMPKVVAKDSLTPKDGRKYYNSPVRIAAVTKEVCENLNKHTNIGSTSFSAMFACDGKQAAFTYYSEFKKTIKEVAIVISAADNDQINGLDVFEFFNRIWEEYDDTYGTNFYKDGLNVDKDLNNYRGSNSFSALRSKYVEDVAARVKSGEIKLLIVSDMFLTGFDAPIVNTIYIDKNLESFLNLIQALSRPNRLYNKDKKFAQVVLLKDRDLKDRVIEAIKAYSNSDNISGIVEVLDYEKLLKRIKLPINSLFEWEINGDNLERTVNGKLEVVTTLEQLTNVSSYLSDTWKILNLLKVCVKWNDTTGYPDIISVIDEDLTEKLDNYDNLKEALRTYQTVIAENREKLSEKKNDDKELVNVDVELLNYEITIDADYINQLMNDVVFVPKDKRDQWVDLARRNLKIISVDEMNHIARNAFNAVVDDVEAGNIDSSDQINDKFSEYFDKLLDVEVVALAEKFKLDTSVVRKAISFFESSGNHSGAPVQDALSGAGYGVRSRRKAYRELYSTVEDLVRIKVEIY